MLLSPSLCGSAAPAGSATPLSPPHATWPRGPGSGRASSTPVRTQGPPECPFAGVPSPWPGTGKEKHGRGTARMETHGKELSGRKSGGAEGRSQGGGNGALWMGSGAARRGLSVKAGGQAGGCWTVGRREEEGAPALHPSSALPSAHCFLGAREAPWGGAGPQTRLAGGGGVWAALWTCSRAAFPVTWAAPSEPGQGSRQRSTHGHSGSGQQVDRGPRSDLCCVA